MVLNFLPLWFFMFTHLFLIQRMFFTIVKRSNTNSKALKISDLFYFTSNKYYFNFQNAIEDKNLVRYDIQNKTSSDYQQRIHSYSKHIRKFLALFHFLSNKRTKKIFKYKWMKIFFNDFSFFKILLILTKMNSLRN